MNATTEATIDVMIADEGWQDELDEPEQWVHDVAARVLAHELAKDASDVELSVLLTNDMQIAELNRVYRNKDGATNVLSFPADAGLGGMPSMLGDVVLARETVLREAEEQGKSVTDHATHLLVHGVLHLLGYDHENDEDAAAMEAHEVALLAELDIGNPYH